MKYLCYTVCATAQTIQGKTRISISCIYFKTIGPVAPLRTGKMTIHSFISFTANLELQLDSNEIYEFTNS